jgi:hypothetical protein
VSEAAPATPELHRPVRLEHIGAGVVVEVKANPDERAALAARLGLVSVDSLHCTFDLARMIGGCVPARGMLRAVVVQACVVSLEPFEATVAEDFEVRFVPEGTESDEVDLEAVDELPYSGSVLDLGEAAAEQLALALDPFPRKPGAELPEGADDEGGAFSVLRGLGKA